MLEADDLGLLHAFNEGIREAFQRGSLTSTCLRANGFAFQHAINEVLPSCKGLTVGVHLCLNEAKPVADAAAVTPLLDRLGRLRSGYVWLISLSRKPNGMLAIERELRAQIEKVLAVGVSIDHLNSHQHVHMIPPIFECVCRLAAEYGVPAVRLSRELPHSPIGLRRRVQPLTNANFAKHHLLNYYARQNERYARSHGLPVTDYFLGVRYTGVMSVSTIRAGLAAVPYGSVELLLHPAIGPDPRDANCPLEDLRRYVAASRRAGELRALCSDRLADFLRSEGWTPTTFGAWAKRQREIMPRETTPEIRSEVRTICEAVRPGGPLWVSAAHDDSRAFAQLALEQSKPGERVLDVGTGTGVIAICLARADRKVSATDISAAAVRTARANAGRAGVAFDCRRSDLLADVRERFDLIVFNPPYGFGPDNFFTAVAKNLLRRVPLVRKKSGLAMPRRVLKFHQELIERLIRQAPERLGPGGRILIHAYESEVPGLQAVLPEGATVELLHHAAFANQTVGMLIRLPA
ncbi:MAG: ChbG/HpnK family deacetylase [Planctomycetes bacterium]|nr:ChbG/HpnK family deacetylase [Planctomycetota bacterium]